MIYTTLNRIRVHSPCWIGWKKLLLNLGKTEADDELLSYEEILKSNGIDDALWCIRAEPQESRLWRMFAVSCAESVRHFMCDPRSLAAIVVARRHAEGSATDDELAAANVAAWAAVAATNDAPNAANYATWAAAWSTTNVAAWAAWATARYASKAAINYASKAAWFLNMLRSSEPLEVKS